MSTTKFVGSSHFLEPGDIKTDKQLIFAEISVSPSAELGHGKLYVKSSDNHLYFKDSNNIEYDIINTVLNSVTGAGAIGRLAIWNGTNEITSDLKLFYDFGTDSLGVGASGFTPQAVIHTKEGTAVKPSIVLHNTNTGPSPQNSIHLVNETNALTNNVSIENRASGILAIRTGATTVSGFGTERLTIHADGKVGINQINPVNRLDITGSVVIGTNISGTLVAPADSLVVENKIGVGTAAPDDAVDVQQTQTAPLNISVKNDGTDTTSDAGFITTANALGGDPKLTLSIDGVTSWTLGVDNDDFDHFKIQNNPGLTTAPDFVLTTSGLVGLNDNAPNDLLTMDGVLSMKEQGAAPIDYANYGKLYVNAANNLIYRKDSGDEFDLTAGGGGGTGDIDGGSFTDVYNNTSDIDGGAF